MLRCALNAEDMDELEELKKMHQQERSIPNYQEPADNQSATLDRLMKVNQHQKM